MNSKLTLRMDHGVIAAAKKEAAQRGKSVSQMVGEFIRSLARSDAPARELPPVTSSLLGLLKNSRVSEEAYKKHLLEKYGR